MRQEGCADGRSWSAEGQFGNVEENVDEMEKKMKLQRVLKRAHDVVRMLNRAGWNTQTDKVKRIKAIIEEPLFKESPNDRALDEELDPETNLC
jgi:hypothetical protein